MSELMIVIPARYQSSRFPGKPLAELLGKPMIEWVVKRCRQSELADRILVATDDQRIYQAVTSIGGEAEITDIDHQSGTDRIAEIAARHPDTTWFINIQGDEPDISPLLIDGIAAALRKSSSTDNIITARCPITSSTDFLSPHVVKVVTNFESQALYFSRSPIPHNRSIPVKKQTFPNPTCWQHIGIYGYHRSFLQRLPELKPGKLEKIESLEQLRWLENGYS
ncbi:MAG: 3-deoxy-manno-octulosonate cytidylyltransferase, partial [Xanthomonadaceae bacterium]|nr:3-deoxy-manno-octulosonate cytidylyltransferase [Xanthomonadaceae bacterium]